jgi:hypothetical protein
MSEVCPESESDLVHLAVVFACGEKGRPLEVAMMRRFAKPAQSENERSVRASISGHSCARFVVMQAFVRTHTHIHTCTHTHNNVQRKNKMLELPQWAHVRLLWCHAGVRVHTYIHIHTCMTYTYTHVCVCTHMYVYTNTHTHVCVYVHTCMCTHTHTHTHVCVCTYMYVYTHTHVCVCKEC